MSQPPPVPDKAVDTASLVKFAVECTADLTQQIAAVGSDPTAFPRTPKLLKKVIDFRYPGLVKDVRHIKTISSEAQALVPGLTFPITPVELVHGRRAGRIILTVAEESARMRMAYAQELFQRVLDIPSMSPSLRSHVDNLLEYKRNPNWEAASDAVVLEFLPEIAAMEFFFPFELRTEVDDANVETLAAQFEVPTSYIGRHLSEGYMRYFERFHDIVKQ